MYYNFHIVYKEYNVGAGIYLEPQVYNLDATNFSNAEKFFVLAMTGKTYQIIGIIKGEKA